MLVGGAAGTLARAELAVALAVRSGQWPWATFAVNIVGALALGAVAALTQQGTGRRALLGAGLCGGLTTFSTLQLELLRMLDAGRGGLAVGYGAASIALGLLAAVLGHRAAGGVWYWPLPPVDLEDPDL